MAVTLAEIAALAGVSRGTVDRALNNRGRVDPKVAARVRRIAVEMGYRPNRAGRMLALAKHPIKIGVIVQSVETMFMHMVYEETSRACARLKSEGADVLLRPIEGVDAARQLEAIDELVAEGMNGLAITPAEDEAVRARLRALSEDMPIVTFNTDLPECGRICYIGSDNYACGRACAGLMDLLLAGDGEVLVVAGQENNLSHRQRVEGFCDEAAAHFPGLQLLPPETCGDDQKLAHDIICRAVAEHPDLRGVYVSVNGQIGACDALRELGLQGKVHLICHDLSEINAANIRAGLIDFLIDQDARLQGVRPVKLLLDYLLVGEKPETDRILARIDIRNRYNV
ncbi:LacI family DNA-binding transcriptional regulator [Agathobaculum sp. Marseille-P7918]|uniref:LacI family DNA-binding transcriptional regulator n=1 Tax=Agathobaculum sp. Marseille-P7918 TaxID=2479843 RepID=UPI000F641F17|nr:LacI family DNA-binding transcriptional regulator [Agathobaculum sp. Marseille-P7918]